MAIDDPDGRLLDRPATESLGNPVTGHVRVSLAMATTEKDNPPTSSSTPDTSTPSTTARADPHPWTPHGAPKVLGDPAPKLFNRAVMAYDKDLHLQSAEKPSSSRACTPRSPPESGALAAPTPPTASGELGQAAKRCAEKVARGGGVLPVDRQMPTVHGAQPATKKRLQNDAPRTVETAPADGEHPTTQPHRSPSMTSSPWIQSPGRSPPE
jgi:hypothetical protein